MSEFPLVNQRKITNNVNITLSQLHSIPIYSFLKQNGLLDQTKEQFSRFCVAMYQENASKKFHKGLNFFERNFGFVSKQKLTHHRTMTAFKSGALDFAIQGGVDVLLFWLEQRDRKRHFKELVEFYCGWMATINQTQTHLMQNRAQQLYRSLGYDFNLYDYQVIIDRYLSSDRIMAPRPNIAEPELQDLYVNLLTACDLSQEHIRSKALEMGSFLNISSNDLDDIATKNVDASELASRLHQVASLGYQELFGNLIDNLEKSKQSAVFLNEHDPFHQQREANKKRLIKGAALGTSALLTLTTGPVGDVALTLLGGTIYNMLDKDSYDDVISIENAISKFKKQRRKS